MFFYFQFQNRALVVIMHQSKLKMYRNQQPERTTIVSGGTAITAILVEVTTFTPTQKIQTGEQLGRKIRRQLGK